MASKSALFRHDNGFYAALFCVALSFAQRARWNAAIFLRAAADIVRFTRVVFVLFGRAVGCDVPRSFAHLAFCACAILRREAADIIRVGWLALRIVAEPFNDWITEIA